MFFLFEQEPLQDKIDIEDFRWGKNYLVDFGSDKNGINGTFTDFLHSFQASVESSCLYVDVGPLQVPWLVILAGKGGYSC